MIWNGTDPLQPDHEVAYRGWPTERVRIREIDWHPVYPVVMEHFQVKEFYTTHRLDGKYYHDAYECDLDLIPLQQEQPK